MLVGIALIMTGVFLACVAAIQTGVEDREKWAQEDKKRNIEQ
jgi:hypothetical protein